MTVLSKEAILSATDAVVQSVEVPEWGGGVFLRVMSGTELDAFETVTRGNGNGSPPNLMNLRARLAAVTLCDAKGLRLFTDQDAVELGRKNGVVLDRIFDASYALNKMGQVGIERAEKN